MRRGVLLVTWAGVLLTAAHAGGALEQDGLSAARGGTLRLSSFNDPGPVDPALLESTMGWLVQAATCAKLYATPDRAAPAGTRVVPEVAVAHPHVSPDGRTHTIELRRTYRFHSGQRVTAANYVAAVNRAANPRMQSQAVSYLREIVGADAVLAGRAQTVAGVRALGPYRLRFRTTTRLPDLASRLTMPFFCPVAVNTPADPAGIPHPLGSGPYFVASRVPNRSIVLERNRHYRGARAANVDRILWEIGRTREACRLAVEANTVDYCVDGVGTTVFGEIAEKYGINVRDGRFSFRAGLGVFFFAFNHDRRAFKGAGQIPLKKAINLAIDRPALVRVAGYLGGRRTDQLLPPAFGQAASIYPLGGVPEQRLRRARALVDDARFKPERLVLYTFAAGGFVPRAEIFRFNMQQIGIDVDIRFFGPDSFLERIGTRPEPYDVVVTGWSADYADPGTILGPLLDGRTLQRKGNTNYAHYDKPAVNREIARMRLLTGEARRRAWAELDVRIMRDDPPYAPFANTVSRIFVSESTGCVVADPLLSFLNIVAACKK